jgi:hypothetical protein
MPLDTFMIDALVRRFLGTAGSSFLDSYLHNSFLVNGLLFAYVLLVLFARRNYFQVAESILADFFEKHGDKLKKKSPNEIRALVLRWKVPWENGMRAGWFPFISYPQGLLLRFKNSRTFQKLFPIDALVEIIVKQTSSRSK